MPLKLRWPLDKVYITQNFGSNPEAYKRYGLVGHNGIDLRTRYIDSPLGRRNVNAAANGVVEAVRYDIDGYGIHVRLRHDDGSMTIYAHLTKPYVSKGQRIGVGARLGLSGNTGFSSGPHLHFEYRPPGWEKNRLNGFGGAADPRMFFI
jgi:murein DD-endopeptidase MepM/ murein hydrolase activator NlpD